MIVLDENIPGDQADRVRRWTSSVLQIGEDVGRKSMSDTEIVAMLSQMRQPTFFSRDRDFFDPEVRDPRYCLVWLDVRPVESADYVRRVIRHPELKTKAQRLGTVIAAAPTSIRIWRHRERRPFRFAWPD